MTEQQIERLKTILNSSPKEQNSNELDEKILLAAREQRPNPEPVWRISSFSPVGTAAMAVVLTAGAFWAMSVALLPNELLAPVALEEQSIEFTVEPQELARSAGDNSRITRPGNPPLYQRSAGETKEQLLAGLGLLNTEALLDSMDFPVARDRQSAKLALNTAMVDINQMLNSGQFKDARRRYDRLRRNCQVCTLPLSLEALALAGNDKVNRL
jgi:hypothetical protein